ncbi:Zinc finger MYM-type protein 1 [Linum grandiflorum]
MNRGNLIEWLELLTEWTEDVKAVVLQNAPGNAKYIAPNIQKEKLEIMANRVRRKIREEVGDACISILVDEAQDQAGLEQMTVIFRLVNSAGILTEGFFAIKSVANTTTVTLKKKRGQRYDGASNMSGQYNGLKALFLQECPYAYFVHCFAHRLQLTLVASAKDCSPIWKFFSLLDKVIKLVKSSPKCTTELLEAHKRDTEQMVERGKLETGRGANQNTTLQRAGATHWRSHFFSVDSLIKMFAAVCEVLMEVSKSNTWSRANKAEAEGALEEITTFKFVFCLHMMRKIMMETLFLSQAFQRESVDILEAVGMVSTSKDLLRKLSDEGWEPLLEEVNSFCSNHDIDIPDLNMLVCCGMNKMPLDQLYHFEYFNQVIDYQMSEQDSRFNETTVRLLQLGVALDPRDSLSLYNAYHIYQLAVEFYPQDFADHEQLLLRSQLPYYECHVVRNSDFKVPSVAKLLEMLLKRRLEEQYTMICRLIRLPLTLY